MHAPDVKKRIRGEMAEIYDGRIVIGENLQVFEL